MTETWPNRKEPTKVWKLVHVCTEYGTGFNPLEDEVLNFAGLCESLTLDVNLKLGHNVHRSGIFFFLIQLGIWTFITLPAVQTYSSVLDPSAGMALSAFSFEGSFLLPYIHCYSSKSENTHSAASCSVCVHLDFKPCFSLCLTKCFSNYIYVLLVPLYSHVYVLYTSKRRNLYHFSTQISLAASAAVN